MACELWLSIDELYANPRASSRRCGDCGVDNVWQTHGVHRTTIYLPLELERALTRIARREGRSEAELIREAVWEAVEQRRAASPRIPLIDRGLGDPDLARRVGDALDGFGS